MHKSAFIISAFIISASISYRFIGSNVFVLTLNDQGVFKSFQQIQEETQYQLHAKDIGSIGLIRMRWHVILKKHFKT
jgi:hypothetical protein